MYAIRADGNQKIGAGHIIRCSAVANELIDHGNEVLFICSDEESASIIKSLNFNCELTNSHWNDLESEINSIISIINKFNVEKILIDSYFITAKYLNLLSVYSKTCYIDDIFSFKYPVNLLVNYNISHEKFDYISAYSASNTKLLLGSLYAPLRKEFYDMIPFAIKDNISNVLVTTGGTDNFDICGKLIEKFTKNLELKNINFHIIVGPFFKFIDKLKMFSNKFNNIIIHENETNISKIMQNSDVAISASGSTFMELCACGIPSVIFSIAENQYSIINTIKEKNLALCSGMHNDKCFIDEVHNNLIKLAHDKSLRLFYRQQMRSVTDGKGAGRIAGEMISL